MIPGRRKTWIGLVIHGLAWWALAILVATLAWPWGLIGALLFAIYGAMQIWQALSMRKEERELRPQFDAYVAANPNALRELDKARDLRWVARFAFILLIGSALYARMGGGEAWFVIGGSLCLAAVIAASLYAWYIQKELEMAATRLPNEAELLERVSPLYRWWWKNNMRVVAIVFGIGVFAIAVLELYFKVDVQRFLFGVLIALTIFGFLYLAWYHGSQWLRRRTRK